MVLGSQLEQVLDSELAKNWVSEKLLRRLWVLKCEAVEAEKLGPALGYSKDQE